MDREAFDDPVLGRVAPGGSLYEWENTVPVGGRGKQPELVFWDDYLEGKPG